MMPLKLRLNLNKLTLVLSVSVVKPPNLDLGR